MKDYERDCPDHTRRPDWEHGTAVPSNSSANPTFHEVAETRHASRRDVLMGGLAAFIGGMIGAGATARRAMATGVSPSALMGFAPVPVGTEDTVTVPAGYHVTNVLVWGDPISGPMPAYAPDNSGEDQFHQVGQHHEGQHFFPIEGVSPYEGSSTDGLYVVNHECVDPRFLHAAAYAGAALRDGEVMVAADGTRPADHVLKEINAHGVSVARIREAAPGEWEVVADPRNRRITAGTPMQIGGPVRGYHKLRTKYSPDGTMTRGTINNCGHGVTPWNTYLTCEENWAGYFVNRTRDDQKPDLSREHARYGVPSGERSRYGWELADSGADAFVRFDATVKADDATGDYRNEPNAFGWVVEIDPFDPESPPVKRTHLGRFAHQGVVFANAVVGRPVVAYAGDDARFEYIYKFVSDGLYEPGVTDGAILDTGTLHVAKFNADGTGAWLALAPGRNGLTPQNGFENLADILINTRLAADTAGATRMDRPEWGAVDPATGEVYFTLTNNIRRTEAQVDPANPRANDPFGRVIRWRENRDDPAATGFTWDLFVIAGNGACGRTAAGAAPNADNNFACPGRLWFDAGGRLWIRTATGESAQDRGDLAPPGSNAMLCADPATAEIRRFLTCPVGQEITGVCTTPDGRTMFVGVRHPGANTLAERVAAGTVASHWPGMGKAVPRSATLVVTRDDGGIVGA